MIDPSLAIPTVEIRTRVTPTIRVSTSAVQGGGPSPFLKLLAPTVVARDANDSALFQIAPYGIAQPGAGALVFASVVVGALAVAFLAGRWTA